MKVFHIIIIIQRDLRVHLPKNGQAALDNSIPFKDTSRARISVDAANKEIVVLHPSNIEGTVFHGHVRTWKELTEQMKNALMRSGLVSPKGKIK